MSALKEIREARAVTIKQMAERMNTTEVSIERYEKEENRLRLPLLRQFAKELNCTIAEIVEEVTPIVFIPENTRLDFNRMADVIERIIELLGNVKLRPFARNVANVILLTYEDIAMGESGIKTASITDAANKIIKLETRLRSLNSRSREDDDDDQSRKNAKNR